MDDELKNYTERHRSWQNQAINQLSFTNNFLLTISIGFLAYAFRDQKDIQLLFDSSIFNLLTLIFILFAIFEGILVIISRLNDFRISRHITYVRQRYYTKMIKEMVRTLPDSDFPRPHFCIRVNVICKIFFCKIDFLTHQEILKLKDQELNMEKFNSLRELAHTLGIISWIGFKFQAIFLFLSCFFFVLRIWF